MTHTIKTGSLLVLRNGHKAIATSEVFTRLKTDWLDLELGWAGMEGGTAVPAVHVLFPDTGQKSRVDIDFVQAVL